MLIYILFIEINEIFLKCKNSCEERSKLFFRYLLSSFNWRKIRFNEIAEMFSLCRVRQCSSSFFRRSHMCRQKFGKFNLPNVITSNVILLFTLSQFLFVLASTRHKINFEYFLICAKIGTWQLLNANGKFSI